MVTSEAFLLIHAAEASTAALVAIVGERLRDFARVSAGRFTLFARDPSRVITVAPDGLVFGRMFRRHGPSRAVRTFDDAEAAALLARPEAALAREFWGNYVVALDDPAEPAVLRAPMGQLPCFAVSIGGDRAFSSDLATLRRSGLQRPKIDWRGVTRALLRRDLPSPSTAVEGVTEVLPGVRRSWRGGHDRDDPFWSPWDHVDLGRSRDPLKERLRRVVQNTTAALADEFAGVLLGASGGLDSSVLACCLARAERDCTLLTMATASPDGDERRYARAIAGSVGRSLVERFYDAPAIDLDRAISAHLPRPIGWIHEGGYHAAVREEAERARAQVFVSGNGGDNSFYNTVSARPLVDSLLERRSPAASARTAADIAALTGATYGAVAREAWRVWRARRRPYVWKASPDLLAPDAVAAAEEDIAAHAWLAGPTALPGKIGHVAMLLRMQNHLGGFDPAWMLPVLNPLAAQPVVELCLGIPSWRWIAGGIDRRPVRDAFGADLPTLVARRRSKGTPHEVVVTLLRQRASEIAERLLDGQLARNFILDRARLAAQLAHPERAGHPDPLTLMSLLNAEAWARSLA